MYHFNLDILEGVLIHGQIAERTIELEAIILLVLDILQDACPAKDMRALRDAFRAHLVEVEETDRTFKLTHRVHHEDDLVHMVPIH